MQKLPAVRTVITEVVRLTNGCRCVLDVADEFGVGGLGHDACDARSRLATWTGHGRTKVILHGAESYGVTSVPVAEVRVVEKTRAL